MRIVVFSPATPGLEMSMSRLPVVRFDPAPKPIAILLLPVVLEKRAWKPMAVFDEPDVFP